MTHKTERPNHQLPIHLHVPLPKAPFFVQARASRGFAADTARVSQWKLTKCSSLAVGSPASPPRRDPVP